MRRGYWKPSEADKAAFKAAMAELETYVKENHIDSSAAQDSFYFDIEGRKFRVSNHSVEKSNRSRCMSCPLKDELTGCRGANMNNFKCTRMYHLGGREDGVTYIHASKTRLVEIHKALLAGQKLDGRGNAVKD